MPNSSPSPASCRRLLYPTFVTIGISLMTFPLCLGQFMAATLPNAKQVGLAHGRLMVEGKLGNARMNFINRAWFSRPSYIS